MDVGWFFVLFIFVFFVLFPYSNWEVHDDEILSCCSSSIYCYLSCFMNFLCSGELYILQFTDSFVVESGRLKLSVDLNS